MNNFEELTRWAEEKGVRMNGIAPQSIPGRGTGMFATRGIKTLITVPRRALRTLDTIPKVISRRLPKDSSLHGLLATDLARDKSDDFAPWKAVVPTLADFEAGTPLMWPAELQALLPKTAKDILRKQQIKFQREWNNTSSAFPDIGREQFLYAWLLVNTRTFYFSLPKMERLPHDDRQALLPLADLFNHADIGCETEFSTESYTIAADREYSAGEEIYVSYGNHSNDFLMTEYGFVLAENRWDAVCLDDALLPMLSEKQKLDLDDRAFLGNYMLDAQTAGCHRTQVALRLLCCTHKQWQRFVESGNDTEASQRKVDNLLMQVLEKFLAMIQDRLEDVQKVRVGLNCQRELLARRWKQIDMMVTHTIERLRN